ncbi:MAG: hypothetical protein RIC84_25210 [Aggregatilineales bacterium]
MVKKITWKEKLFNALILLTSILAVIVVAIRVVFPQIQLPQFSEIVVFMSWLVSVFGGYRYSDGFREFITSNLDRAIQRINEFTHATGSRVIDRNRENTEEITQRQTEELKQDSQTKQERIQESIGDIETGIVAVQTMVSEGLDGNQEALSQLAVILQDQPERIEVIIKNVLESEREKHVQDRDEYARKLDMLLNQQNRSGLDEKKSSLRSEIILTFVRFRDQFAITKEKRHVESLNELRLRILDLAQESEVYLEDDLQDINYEIWSAYLELVIAIDRHEKQVPAPEKTKEQWFDRIYDKRNEELYAQIRSITEQIKARLNTETNPRITLDHDKTQQTQILESLSSASQTVKNAYTALFSEEANKRTSAVETLYQSEDPHSITALELAQSNSIPQVRIHSAIALAEKTEGKNEHALSGLLEALDVEDIDTKDRALKSIWQIFFEIPLSVSRRPIEKLIEVLSDMDVDTRWTAEHVLISQCDKTLPYLIEAISHEFSSVQIAVLEAIWIITTNNTLPRSQLLTAVPQLIEALKKHDQSVTPRDKEYTSVSKLAQKILIELAPIEELEEYLQNDRTWMHKYVNSVIRLIQNGEVDDQDIPETQVEEAEIVADVPTVFGQEFEYEYSLDETTDTITREDLLVMVELTRNMMIDFATEKGYSESNAWKSEQERNYLRNQAILLSINDGNVQSAIPRILKTNMSLSSVRNAMQAESENYRGRREYLHQAFSALIDLLDGDHN